jgi:hypothetical protein
LYLIEEDTYTAKDLAEFYPEIVQRAELIMASEYEPHEWYWNPNESRMDFEKKKKLAAETDNVLPIFRPNGIVNFPWEKK